MDRSSGKLLILGMLAVGLLAALASWWFRFSATHRAARFWGPEASALIRDAPEVEAFSLISTDDPEADVITIAGRSLQIVERQDASQARGLTHLRFALLEDSGFRWPAEDAPVGAEWKHGLRFRDPRGSSLTILFTSDYLLLLRSTDESRPQVVSCEPIAKGLGEVLREWTSTAGAAPVTPNKR